MKKLSNTKAELKKSVAYKKKRAYLLQQGRFSGIKFLLKKAERALFHFS